MVAARSRITALWFAALMLLSIVPAIVPTASATHITAAQAVFVVTNDDGASYFPYDGRVVGPNMKVGVNVTADIVACAALTTDGQASLDVNNEIFGSANPAAVTLALVSGTSYAGDIRFTTVGNFAAPNGLEGTAQTFTVTIDRRCGGQTSNLPDTTGATVETSPGINVDTLAPRMATPTIALLHPASRVNTGANTAAIGTTISLTGPFASDPNGLNLLEIDLGTLGGAAGRTVIPHATQPAQSVVVAESGGSVPVIEATRSVWYFARDIHGNTNSSGNITTQPSVVIDNTRPNPTNFVAGRAELMLSQRTDSWQSLTDDSEFNVIKVNWASSDADIAFGQLSATANGVTWPIGNVSEPPADILSTNVTFTIFDDPATAFDENQRTAWAFTLMPVDAAGNVGNDVAGDQRSYVFPTMNVQYGVLGDSPRFVGGNLLGNVYVNLTSGVPTVPFDFPPTSPGDLWGQLIRERASAWTYWQVDKTGNAESHFSGQNLAPAIVSGSSQTNNAASTVFRTAGPITTTPVATVPIILNNLSNIAGRPRAFLDGSYQLQINLTADNGNVVSHILRFDVDSGDPKIESHPRYSNGPGPNMTQLHGMDGNPFRVSFHVSDQRNVTSNTDPFTLLDSGLRNITFQIVDQDGSVAKRTSTGADASFDLNVLTPTGLPSYIYDMDPPPTVTAGNECTPTTQNTPACAWEEIFQNGTWRATFFNLTRAGGWINTTFNDLAPGVYSIRVLATDLAGRTASKSYQIGTNDAYQVAPAVKVLSTIDSPRVRADGTLDVTIAATQRYTNTVSLPDTIRDKCVRDVGRTTGIADICPPKKVIIYVSNSNTATAGTPYQERLGDFAPATTIDNLPSAGFDGAYGDAFSGALRFCDPGQVGQSIECQTGSIGVPMRYFQYPAGSQALAIPSGINLNQPIYVRAEVIAYNAAGQPLVTRTTDWVRAASAALPSIQINQPATEWALNITAATDAATAQPPFNVSFSRTDPGTPLMQYQIVKIGAETVFPRADTIITNVDSATLDTTGNANPVSLFNWTGRLTTGSGGSATKLLAGSYQLRTCVYVGTTTCYDSTTGAARSGATRLAETWRNFTIINAKPTIAIPTAQTDPHMISKGAGTFVVGSTFDYTFTVAQGDTNISGLRFELLRQDAPAGQPVSFKSNGDGGGTGGFTVNVFEPLPEPTATSTTFNARVTLPLGLVNQNQLILTTIALTDVAPLLIGNATNSITLFYDKEAPRGELQVLNTLNTVYDSGSVPPKNRVGTAFDPRLVGTIDEDGAGVKLVEVRIVDLTNSTTLELQLDPAANTLKGAFELAGTDRNFWVSSSTIAGKGAAFVKVTNLGNGDHTWELPLLDTSPFPPLFRLFANGSVNEASSAMNLSHTYRIDVRFTDHLDQVSPINSTVIDFDGAAPYLGYKGQLGVASTTPSGLTASKRSINWHGLADSLILTAYATDNHCISAVRLVGSSTLNSTQVKADMRPVATISGTTRTDIGDPTKVCPNGLKTEYTLDLATVPHMTEDVANYTYWFEAVDWAGQVTVVEPAHRLLKVEVLDASPAVVHTVTIDPPVGQAGGRALVRARVFENLNLSHVTLTVTNFSSGAVLAQRNMTPENGTGAGFTWWRADTTDDLNLTFDVGEYKFNVTAYDVNWNRTINPTCQPICQPFAPLYLVRDDGNPAVVLHTPSVGATLNATPTITFRALHKNLVESQIAVRATTSGNVSNLTAVPVTSLNYTELRSANGTRQGWTVAYSPTGLLDNETVIVNVTATLGTLTDSKEYSFRVDAAGPSVSHNVTGGTTTIAGKEWATRATRVILRANDTVSATTIKYTVNGGPEQTYTSEITPSGADGEWKLEYWASDAAGNLAAKRSVTLNVDVTGPRISVAKHGDDLLLTVTDSGAGLNESTVTVHYRYGGAAAFTPKKAEKLTGNSFGTTLPGNASESGLAYYFTAQDVLGNDGSNYSAAQPYTIRAENVTPVNLPPTIRITSPTAGQDVRSSVEVKWIAEDPEEAPLTISIALQQPPPGRVLVAAGENSGTYTINTTGFAAGAYTVVVTATDGEHSESAQVTFNVQQGDSIQVRNVPPPTVQPNTQIGVAIAITAGKTVQTAQYRLIKDGQPFASGVLGVTQQGLYAAGFTPSVPGNYTVVVDVAYADGTSEPSKQIATFSVPAPVTPPDEGAAGFMPTSVMVLLAVAILTVALAAYGAFGRWKK